MLFCCLHRFICKLIHFTIFKKLFKSRSNIHRSSARVLPFDYLTLYTCLNFLKSVILHNKFAGNVETLSVFDQKMKLLTNQVYIETELFVLLEFESTVWCVGTFYPKKESKWLNYSTVWNDKHISPWGLQPHTHFHTLTELGCERDCLLVLYIWTRHTMIHYDIHRSQHL